MLYLPPLRRLLLPALLFFAIIVIYKSSLHAATSSIPSFLHFQPPPEGIHVPISNLKYGPFRITNASTNHIAPSKDYYYSYNTNNSTSNPSQSFTTRPILNPHLEPLFRCSATPNKYTSHIRLLHSPVLNVSMIPPSPFKQDTRVFWNPTIISLPHWSPNQYLVVSRIVTDGNHQQNVLCEANICFTGSSAARMVGERKCSEEDVKFLGTAGGMRCETEPTTLSVPPTPAEKCEGKFGPYADIPGFHDPRIFWSGKGEPLMMVNTQSRYACFGLWLIDLRSLHPPLSTLLASAPVTPPSLGPLMSYATLTELTRNPPSTRSQIEKNWLFFFPSPSIPTINGELTNPTIPGGEAYIHYELTPDSRTFAKLLGGGLTTTNLTDPLELPCLTNDDQGGTWHQATNSLRLILCSRADKACVPSTENTVFFSLIHRKLPNYIQLPLRYERYFAVWSSHPPFSMLGVSSHPLLMANETATGFSAAENWDDDPVARKEGRRDWAYFTYTVSIAYVWRPRDGAESKNTGFLDDEVLLAIGVDDVGQGFARVKAEELVQCLKACPGRAV